MLRIILLLIVSITMQVNAKGADIYVNALKLYQNGLYKDAYPILVEESKRGNKEAQYLLAYMYENGLGVIKSEKNANYWYKQVASRYKYIIKKEQSKEIKKEKSFFNRLKDQMNSSSEQKGGSFAFSKIDSQSLEVKSKMMKILENSFGMQPYKTNYVAPYTYANTKYTRHFSTYSDGNTPKTWSKDLEYDDYNEVEFQLSFKKPLTYNLFGWNEYITFAYTQQVWWKLYDKSSPFRETNYTPELFITIPTSDKIDSRYNLKAIRMGYKHQSNGQEGYNSRSWNRLFLVSMWQWNNLFVKLQGWYRLPEDNKGEDFYNGTNPDEQGDDNPDILDYMGYGDLSLSYFYGQNQFNLLVRNNFDFKENKGAIQVDWSAPFFSSNNTFWYVKVFHGYGESLIDYDRSVSKLSVGFAFSRSLF